MLIEENSSSPNGMSIEAVAKNGMKLANGSTAGMVAETVVQLKMVNSPVTFWKRRFKDRPFRYRISPMDMSRRDSEAVLENYDGQESSNINDIVQDTSSIKIACLADGQSKLTNQEQFGHIYNADEYVFFSTNVVDPELMVSWSVYFMTQLVPVFVI